MLEDAGGVGGAVRARTPQEHVPFLAWGLLILLVGPIGDFGDDSVVGGIYQWVALAAPVAVVVTYLRQSRQVRALTRSPNWLAPALAGWAVAVTLGLPGLLDNTIGFAHTVAGVLGAAPILWWAVRLHRNA